MSKFDVVLRVSDFGLVLFLKKIPTSCLLGH